MYWPGILVVTGSTITTTKSMVAGSISSISSSTHFSSQLLDIGLYITFCLTSTIYVIYNYLN